MIVVLQTGLTSRFVALAQAYDLYRTGHAGELTLLWVMEEECRVPFHDVFSQDMMPDACLNVIEVPAPVPDIWREGKELIDFTYSKERPEEEKDAYFAINWLRMQKAIREGRIDCLYINTWWRLNLKKGYKTDLSPLRFNPVFREEAERVMKPFGENIIGIHLRRTDNLRCILNSPTETFIREMEHALQESPEASFFVATDDENELSLLRTHFGDRIVSRSCRFDRNTPEGIRDALVDCLCLGMCRFIIGSYKSMFSEFSAAYQGKPLIEIYRDGISRESRL